MKLAKRLLEQLAQSPIVSELGLQTIDGNKVIEVKKAAYNKGTAAEQYIETGDYDFVLAIGDDTTR
ncbi:trehalose-phosphatase [Dyadobacter jiangsuensis]|uniref:Trehalose phosphatase n=1 Tax=Dyadobacter jiangsuensis TaxID=1591085 RepID=A0A2P8FCR5_9BACT|nr:trehalose-phosphatase [Dyadobacter jiangsuensis]PSL19488.1 trehalose phosphatase [Dyadobacter jiangsuensis]